jgi:hypothetical protein
MPAEEDFNRFSQFAEELGLTDDDDEKSRTSFVESAMKRKGYKPVLSWGEPDPPENDKGKKSGDFFGKSGSQYS